MLAVHAMHAQAIGVAWAARLQSKMLAAERTRMSWPRLASSRQTFHMINTCEGAPHSGSAITLLASALLLSASRASRAA